MRVLNWPSIPKRRPCVTFPVRKEARRLERNPAHRRFAMALRLLHP